MQIGVSLVGHGLMAIVTEKATGIFGEQGGGAAMEGVAGRAITGGDRGVQIVKVNDFRVTIQTHIRGQMQRGTPLLWMGLPIATA